MKKIVEDSRIIESINLYTRKNGYPPTTRDIADFVGLKSTANVHARLHKMREKGLINFVDGQPRTVTVIGDKMCKYCEEGNEIQLDEDCFIRLTEHTKEVSLYDRMYGWDSYDIDFNYCPMCGRKLTEEAE